MKFFKPILFVFIALSSTTLMMLNSCSDDDETPMTMDDPPADPDQRSYTGTQSPGDVWQFEIDFGTMNWSGMWDAGTETDPSDDIEFGGTFSELPSGFLKLIIENTTPSHPSYPADGSGFFYAIEVPGMSLFAQPAGSLSGNLINSVDQSDCDIVFGRYNFSWIPLGADYDARTDKAFGTVDISGTVDNVMFSGWQNSLDCVPMGGTCTFDELFNIPGSGPCVNGTVDIMDGSTLIGKAQLTPSRVFMIDFGAGNGGIYGSLENDVTLADIAGKTLVGFNESPEAGQIGATRITFDETGKGGGMIITDLETNTVDTARINNVQIGVTNGMITGHVDNQSGEKSYLAGSATKNDGNIVLTVLSYSDVDMPPVSYPAVSVVVVYTP